MCTYINFTCITCQLKLIQSNVVFTAFYYCLNKIICYINNLPVCTLSRLDILVSCIESSTYPGIVQINISAQRADFHIY